MLPKEGWVYTLACKGRKTFFFLVICLFWGGLCLKRFHLKISRSLAKRTSNMKGVQSWQVAVAKAERPAEKAGKLYLLYCFWR